MYVRQRLPLYVVVVACVLQRVVSLMKQFELNIALLSRLPYLAPTQRFFPHASSMFVHPRTSTEQIFSEGSFGSNNFRGQYSSTVSLKDFVDTRKEQNKVNYMDLENNQ